MTSALVLTSGGPAAPALAADLAMAGIEVQGETDCLNLLQDVVKRAADVVVCFQEAPDAAFFAATAAVAASVPRPVVVFTTDPDAGKMATATNCGVHAYVVAGYARGRLRSVVQLAQARFHREQGLVQELGDVRQRFDERKLVDRAKGILMGARRLREEEAFRALRTAAMASKQRIGQVANVVIDSAHYAEAVNRAGQLRMLSQRMVKAYALLCTGETGPQFAPMLADTVAQVEGILAGLGRSLSRATFSDLLDAVADPWNTLRAALKPPPATGRLREVDRLAERLLEHAETLTANLEVAAFATVLHPINVVGRQRMLVQRLAKEVLVGLLLGRPGQGAAPWSGETFAEFVAGLGFLDQLPLSNAEIARELDATHRAWDAFKHGLADCPAPAAPLFVATSSEGLADHFDRLTEMIERGIHALMGF